jgi:BrnA antitoxin of type II toxin-antitoxin system
MKRNGKPKKEKVTMYLDDDVIRHFKARAALPGAAPYQRQINEELRKVVESGGTPYSTLIRDRGFVAAVAREVHKLLSRRKG